MGTREHLGNIILVSKTLIRGGQRGRLKLRPYKKN